MWIADVESAMEAKVMQQRKSGGQAQDARGREEEPEELEERGRQRALQGSAITTKEQTTVLVKLSSNGLRS
jgi:hypothetical protein